jgi:flavorubredoxin
MGQLAGIDGLRVDYIVAQHAEQDHTGMLPEVLERFPDAQVLTTPKGKDMLVALVHLDAARIRAVRDDEVVSLGDRSLRFLFAPWVHWPETMLTYLPEERLLFTCDFFGSHYATSRVWVQGEEAVVSAAKRYYAEIMMPFRKPIEKHLQRVSGLDIAMLAPSHGPVWDEPSLILDAYRDWVTAPPHNLVVIPFVSMHGSTAAMVDYLVTALGREGVEVRPFDLTVTDVGELAMALVDAATVILGSPTVLGGAHPQAAYAASLANALRPKAVLAGVIGSYGWGAGAARALVGMLPGLRVELLDPLEVNGKPRAEDFAALDGLAAVVGAKHRELGFKTGEWGG